MLLRFALDKIVVVRKKCISCKKGEEESVWRNEKRDLPSLKCV